jgi:hypothetical protein
VRLWCKNRNHSPREDSRLERQWAWTAGNTLCTSDFDIKKGSLGKVRITPIIWEMFPAASNSDCLGGVVVAWGATFGLQSSSSLTTELRSTVLRTGRGKCIAPKVSRNPVPAHTCHQQTQLKFVRSCHGRGQPPETEQDGRPTDNDGGCCWILPVACGGVEVNF